MVYAYNLRIFQTYTTLKGGPFKSSQMAFFAIKSSKVTMICIENAWNVNAHILLSPFFLISNTRKELELISPVYVILPNAH